MSQQHTAIIDYGMGNLHSVASALAQVGPRGKVSVTDDASIIANADRVIFPGVGAIRDCMAEILKRRIDLAVSLAIDSGKPVLAICVGMQALLNSSEENGGVDCLGIFPGKVRAFTSIPAMSSQGLKIPHMGWNNVAQSITHPLWQNIEDNSRFYFVHSYFTEPDNATLVAGQTEYGLDFAAALAHQNLFATQFHPEKSHTVGLQLLQNFLNWNGQI